MSKIKKKVMVYINGQMAVHTKAIGNKGDNMAKASIHLKMVLLNMANGKMVIVLSG